MDGEKSDPFMTAGLSPVPHQWQTAAQPPRPLSWPDTLMYGTDTSGPETSLKPHWLFCCRAAVTQPERCTDWLLAADRQ